MTRFERARSLGAAAIPVIVLALGLTACRDSRPDNWPPGWLYSRDQPVVTGRGGMVVTTDSIATQVGVDVLRAGGNAVDAAVAVAFALAVVNPEAGNIGGGGFMVVRMANGETAALDFREKAPLAATRDMFLDSAGNPTDRSLVGPLAVGVPGSVAGMFEAHARYGTRPWAELIEPAIRLAEGFPVTPRFLLSLDGGTVRELLDSPGAAALYLPGGAPPAVGVRLRLPELAETLRRIRDGGADGFYGGRTAELILEEMKRDGGIITREDLESYATVWREPVQFRYRGYTVISMPPSSSGGTTLAETASILAAFDLPREAWHSTREIHLLAEAWKRAFVDRNYYLADPDFFPDIPVSVLTSSDYGKARAAEIDDGRATPSLAVKPAAEAFPTTSVPNAPAPPTEGTQTTHFSIVDRDGNAVAVTTTLNSWYGSKVAVSGAGFVLNDEMDDFTSKPGVPNQFGLVQGERNAVAPGKRMLSAMSPTIVTDSAGKLFMVLGSPGGPTIITTVFQTLANVVDHGMSLGEAVAAPRVHHQHLPDEIDYEPGGLPESVVEELRKMGHVVSEDGELSGDVQAIRVRGDGTFEGFSDPRRKGKAIGY
jgi:gamma-glutamyltranspeptidase/glutathione hydrolase